MGVGGPIQASCTSAIAQEARWNEATTGDGASVPTSGAGATRGPSVCSSPLATRAARVGPGVSVPEQHSADAVGPAGTLAQQQQLGIGGIAASTRQCTGVHVDNAIAHSRTPAMAKDETVRARRQNIRAHPMQFACQSQRSVGELLQVGRDVAHSRVPQDSAPRRALR